jgi:hypothetical protein
MVFALIILFFLFLIFSTLSFNFYVLISLLLRRRFEDQSLRIGMAVLLGGFGAFVFFKQSFFISPELFTALYGALSGLLMGIYFEAKRQASKSVRTVETELPGFPRDSRSFTSSVWLNSTSRLICYTCFGVTCAFLVYLLLGLVTEKSFYV